MHSGPLLYLVALLCAAGASATIFYHEKFETLEGWVQSEHQKDYGKVELSDGANLPSHGKKGLKLVDDSHFFAVSKKLPTPVSNDGKPLVISFAVTHEQQLTCGGGYIKLLPDVDQKDFHGESPYWLMFGPDFCGDTRKVQIIFNYKGKNVNWEPEVSVFNDKKTHFYTLQVNPNNSYQLFTNGKPEMNGSLETDWRMVQPREMDDPTDKKPFDWDDRKNIKDPKDKMPKELDEEPEEVPDPSAEKPGDWDDDQDGEWAAPMMKNPKHKSEWKPKEIENPSYKGVWKARQIPNPDYIPDPNLYRVSAPLQYVGIDVWQVESGSIFRDIMIGDDIEEVLKAFHDAYMGFLRDEAEMLEEKANGEGENTVDMDHDDEESNVDEENTDSEF